MNQNSSSLIQTVKRMEQKQAKITRLKSELNRCEEELRVLYTVKEKLDEAVEIENKRCEGTDYFNLVCKYGNIEFWNLEGVLLQKKVWRTGGKFVDEEYGTQSFWRRMNLNHNAHVIKTFEDFDDKLVYVISYDGVDIYCGDDAFYIKDNEGNVRLARTHTLSEQLQIKLNKALEKTVEQV